MGYGFYHLDGMDRGYSVDDVCHAPGCGAKIDRGLWYLCYGCMGYFCGKHLGRFGDVEFDCFAGQSLQSCEPCADEAAAEAAVEAVSR